jgi:hypothetical protein
MEKIFGDFLDVGKAISTTQPGVSQNTTPTLNTTFRCGKQKFVVQVGGFPQKNNILAVHREEAKLFKNKK